MPDQLRSTNPATGETFAAYDSMTASEAIKLLEAAQAESSWRNQELCHRVAVVAKLSQQLEADKSALAHLITKEMGKPLSQSVAEIEKCGWLCRYYAEQAMELLKPEEIGLDQGSRAIVSYEPLGVILAVMPWNFPFWQAFRCAVPSMIVGNTFALKHASNVPGCAEAIIETFHRAGVAPCDAVNLPVPSSEVAEIIKSYVIAAVSLTGSEAAGAKVAQAAGAEIKKCVLELGGSDPYIVLADADLELAAEKCVVSRLINSGQSCIAAKRWIVEAAIEQEFTELVKQKFADKKVGDPGQEATDVGPLARPDLRDQVAKQTARSIELGAKQIYCSEVPAGRCYYPVTLLSGVKPGQPAFDEEIFGPVGAVISAASEDNAFALANHSTLGLGGAIFSRDIEKARSLATKKLRVGIVAINDLVKSDPRVPFGGIKRSGYGRELGEWGLKEFVNVKSVIVP